jgi:hypothetical protein
LQVGSNLKIAKDTRRKQGLTALLEALLKLQQANNLQRALKWVPRQAFTCLSQLLLLLPAHHA